MSAEPIRFPFGKRRPEFSVMRDVALNQPAQPVRRAHEESGCDEQVHSNRVRDDHSAGLAEKLLAFEAGLRRPSDLKELCYYVANELSGILPAHVPAFIAAQLAGAVLAWAGMRWLHAESTAAAPEQVGAEQSQEAGP